MAGLPKKYIQKYGVSKKAWREYRKSKKSKRTRRSVKTMPRKRKRYRRSKKMDMKPLLYGAGYAVIGQPALEMISNKLNLGLKGDLARLAGSGAAFYLGKGAVREIGRAGLYIEANNVAKQGFGSISNIFQQKSTTLVSGGTDIIIA